ncbi:hypothetical protein HGRIS_013398 [Hohenbuehelia grisea]|uniref:Uncharacterized protein n=1 Tax=Hohenbuehelia grisea TaxID=104357 RepID=A0ABR3IVE2_9AGAR
MKLGSSACALVDVNECKWTRYLPLLACEYPVWLYWGEWKPGARWNPPKDSHLQSYCPTLRDIESFLQTSDSSPSPNWAVPPPTSGLRDIAHAPALPDPITHQIPGESRDQFFARQKTRNDRIAAKEDRRAREDRVERESYAATHRDPDRKGPTVFVWEKNSDGTEIRVPVPRSNVSFVWKNFADTQRRFNGFRNEWGLCLDFDCGAVRPTDDFDDDCDDNIRGSVADIPNQHVGSPIKPTSHRPSAVGDGSQVVHHRDYAPPSSEAPAIIPLADFVLTCFGYVELGQDPPDSTEESVREIAVLKRVLLRSTSSVSEKWLKGVHPFLCALWNVPPSLTLASDLRDDSPSPLVNHDDIRNHNIRQVFLRSHNDVIPFFDLRCDGQVDWTIAVESRQ